MGYVIFFNSLNLPCLLIFTIKRKKKAQVIQSNQPPNALQFHDESLIEMTNNFQSLHYNENLANEKTQKVRSNVNDFSKNRDRMMGEQRMARNTDNGEPLNFQGGNSQHRIGYSQTNSVNAPLSRETSTEIVCIERVTIISDWVKIIGSNKSYQPLIPLQFYNETLIEMSMLVIFPKVKTKWIVNKESQEILTIVRHNKTAINFHEWVNWMQHCQERNLME